MKAQISTIGMLCLIPESTTEQYALTRWKEHNRLDAVETCVKIGPPLFARLGNTSEQKDND